MKLIVQFHPVLANYLRISLIIAAAWAGFFAAIFTQPAYPAEYYKCTDAKGRIYVSNVACPPQAEKGEARKFRELSEREVQEMQQRLKEEAKQQEDARNKAEQLEMARQRKLLLDQCLNDADEQYRKQWDYMCLFGGSVKGCLLNTEIADGLDRNRRGDRDECFKRYPPL